MTLQLLLQRFVALFLLLTTLTACSSADSATPSTTQTPIPATPTHTATFTPSPTDTPTATITPTEAPSALSLMAVWNPDKPGGMTEADFPMFDMVNSGRALDERLAQLKYNGVDGSSTLNGEVLFAADTPKAVFQEPMPGKFILRPRPHVEGWYKFLSVYKADSDHGAIVTGSTEYRAQIAMNLEDGVVIQDVLIGLNNDNVFESVRIGIKLELIEWSYYKVFPEPSKVTGYQLLQNPWVMRGFQINSSNQLEIKPEYAEFFAQVMQGKMIQMHIPLPGLWSDG